MARRNTKDIILFAALKLFADKGYDGVTVRDIAEAVGIMQSSLYKHYASKQEIFDTLVARMEQYFSEVSENFLLPEGDLDQTARAYATGGSAVLKEISTTIFRFYIRDERASQFRRMLTIEKYKSGAIAKIYRDTFIDAIINYQTPLFAKMVEQGYMRPVDPHMMAIHFFAPVFMFLGKYDTLRQQEAEAIGLLEKHIDQFDLIYRKEGNK